MKSILATVTTLCLLVATSNGQPVPSSVGAMHSAHGTYPGQMMQQLFTYRLLFGDAMGRVLMAENLAQSMGNSPIARYYAGEMVDAPDSWWLASSFMNPRTAPTGSA